MAVNSEKSEKNKMIKEDLENRYRE